MCSRIHFTGSASLRRKKFATTNLARYTQYLSDVLDDQGKIDATYTDFSSKIVRKTIN